MENGLELTTAENGRTKPGTASRTGLLCSLGVLLFAIAHSLWGFSIGWNSSLMQAAAHGWRQTQTAMSVYWMLHGGPWLAYETPLFGPPWSAPMEFPLYQWIVAAFVKIAGTPIDQTGRLVSVLFFFLTLVPLTVLLAHLGVRRELRPIALSAFLLSPIYLYWTRAFLLESTVLFLSVSCVALTALYLDDGRRRWLFAAGIAAILAILVKVTTFVPFLFLAMAMIAARAFSATTTKRLDRRNAIYAALLLVAVPMAALLGWTAYADQIKSRNFLASSLTSEALQSWNFGTMEQRMSAPLWLAIRDRCLPDALGSSLVFAAFLLCLPFVRRRRGTIILLAAAYLLSFILFTNLHLIHNYYQYANAVLVIGMVVLCGSDLIDQGGWRASAGALLLAALLGGSLYAYQRGAYRALQAQQDWDLMPTAAAIKARLNSSEAVLFEGLDFNPMIPYYSERQAIMDHGEWSLSDPRFPPLVTDMGRIRLGAVARCAARKGDRAALEAFLTRVRFQPSDIQDTGVCVVYFGHISPDRPRTSLGPSN